MWTSFACLGRDPSGGCAVVSGLDSCRSGVVQCAMSRLGGGRPGWGGGGRGGDLAVARSGRTVSMLGDEITMVALVLYAARHGPGAVTAVLLVAAVPSIVLAPWVGRLVDRSDSRRVTSLSAVTAAAGTAGMAVCAHRGMPLLIVLAAFAVVQCAQAVADPAWASLVPRIVGEQRAAATAGTQQTLNSVTRLAGPGLGGLLVAAAGAAGAFTADAATFTLLTLGALVIRTRRRPAGVPGTGAGGSTGRAGPGRAVGGWRLVRAEPVIGPVLTILTGFIVLATLTNVAEVLLITGVLGGGPASFGGVGAAVGVGLVGGSLVANRIGSDRGRVVAVCGSAVLTGVLFVAEGLAPTLTVAAALFTVNGLANGVLSSCFGQVLVARTSDAERGRVFAAVAATTQTAAVVGLVLGGVVTAGLAPRAAYVTAGAAAVAITLATLTRTRHRLTDALTAPGPAPAEATTIAAR